mmetsp:Transcript_15308/g.42479  ORF Transcript_15308/g.42479 Transcript_15308/m.42479 type:complete len:104 (-) Transcript_15308:45-356(-)
MSGDNPVSASCWQQYKRFIDAKDWIVAMSPVWQASIIPRTFSIGNDWHPDGSDVDSDVDSNDSAAVAVIVVIVELTRCRRDSRPTTYLYGTCTCSHTRMSYEL